jgi:hypothetical protein
MENKEIVADGRTFKVLSLPEQSEDLRFVKLSSGKIVSAKYNRAGGRGEFDFIDFSIRPGLPEELWVKNLDDYGIVPLCEIDDADDADDCQAEFTGLVTHFVEDEDYFTITMRVDRGGFVCGNPKKILGEKFICYEEFYA